MLRVSATHEVDKVGGNLLVRSAIDAADARGGALTDVAKKAGSTKGNPHASTAAKAIALYSAYTAGAASGVEGEAPNGLALG